MGVLKSEIPACPDPRCGGRKMSLIKFNNLDGRIFKCGKTFKPEVNGQKPRRCQKKISIRKDSYLEKSQLPLRKIAILGHCWALQMSNDKTRKYVGVSRKTTVQW